MKNKRTTEHWFLLLAAGIGLSGLIGIAFFLAPDPRGYGTHEALGFATCMPMEVWNVPCPGCGVTTSVAHAVRGAFLQSILVQPFGFLLCTASIAFIAWVSYGHFRGKDMGHWLASVRWKRWVLAGAIAMSLGWGYKLAFVRGWLETQ